MRTERVNLLAAALLMALGMFPVRGDCQSLIDPASFRGPAADRRAYRVGDVLTVNVLETTRARSQAGTDTDRDANVGIGLHSPSTSFDAGLATNGKTVGAAETRRIGELRTQLSVRITEVDPNGLLHVSGKQVLVVNGEQQHMELSGVVRPEDITADNVVWSNRLADANVSLAGSGIVSEAQRRGLVARIFRWLGLL